MKANNRTPNARRGAASWWLLLALVLVSAFGFYIWFQQNKVVEPVARPIQVATADSSGPVVPPDSGVPPDHPGELTVIGPRPPDTPFIAPPPNFERTGSVPVANLLEYARRMLFDPARGGELSLPVDEHGRTRMVRVEPLANLRQIDSTALAQGRVVARIRSEAALPALSIHNGDNFIWLQGVLGQPLQAEIWSTSVVVPPKIMPLIWSPRPPAGAPADKDAFWQGTDLTSQVFWIACGRGWCHS